MNIMKKILLWVLDIVVSRRFHRGHYKKIIAGLPVIASNEDKASVYSNVIRVASLIKLNDPRWMGDYKAVLNLGTLENLGQDDARYIRAYIHKITNGETGDIGINENFDLSAVTDRTKKYFVIP